MTSSRAKNLSNYQEHIKSIFFVDKALEKPQSPFIDFTGDES